MEIKTALPYIVGGFSALSSFADSQAQASVMRYNAQVAEANALSQRQWAEHEAQQVQEAGRRQRARMLAAQGASGVATGTGSFADVLTDDVIAAEMEALSVRLQGEQRGRFYDAEAGGLRAQARHTSRMAPVSALTSGLQTGLSTYAALGR